MDERAIRGFYPDDAAHCHGWGWLNEHGPHIRSSSSAERILLPTELAALVQHR